MDRSPDSFLADEGHSVFSSKSRRPTTSSLSILRPTFGGNGLRKLGRTKSLLLLDGPLRRMDNPDDPGAIDLREGEHHQHARTGSLRDFISRAHHSIKSKTSRRERLPLPQNQGTNHGSETSAFQRLRQAVCLKSAKHEPVMEIQHGYGLMIAPVPGNGNEPPLIPDFGGTAARANAAASNQYYWQSRHQFEKLEDSQGDRESGIGIATETVASTSSFQQEISIPDSITRVDFMQRLPSELASQILSHLNLRSLRAVELVSRRWNLAVGDPYVWRDVFYQDKSLTYATSKPIAPGAGLGLPALKPSKDWRKVYKVRRQLERNWCDGYSQATYLHGHQDSIYCLQFDETKIITGSRDKTIRVWDIQTFECALVIGCPAVIEELDAMENAQEIPVHYATQPDKDNKDAPVRYTAVCKPKKVSFPMNHNASILCLQYDDEILVTGSSDSTCIVHNIKDGYTPVMRLECHTLAILDLAFDKTHIVTCSKDTTICVWDRATGKLLKQLRGHTGPVNAIQLRGNSVVSCSGDTIVKLWNIDTGRLVREFAGHRKGLACSQFSDDAKLIASAGNDKTIRIWDANTGECIREIEAHVNLVRSLHIDSVSGRLVSGSYDQDIKVWNMASGQLLLDFPKWHASWVLGAKSDYRRIISTGQDPKILIMDFGNGVDGIELLESTPRSAERALLDSLTAEMMSAKI